MAVVKEQSFAGQKNILARPDGYVALEVTLKAADYAGVEADSAGRKIVKAGTILSDGDGAYGVVLNDYDVTDGDVENAAYVIHGDILEDALPTAPTQEQIDALARQGLYFINGGKVVKPTTPSAAV